ncbi:MAG: NAD-dependent epimerase/dehydratase family protein [Candidatus Sericytochromatia bacterium]|nr:NAD-dependent epimerase/dehydratase family protein [Candidatus Sericytochromatia bacterium]
MAHVLVTGGHGFIGSNTVPLLQAAGHRVTVLDRSPPRFGWGGGDRWVQGEFGNAGALAEALEGIEVVVHLVCTTLPKTSNDDPAHDVRTNVADSLLLFDHAARSGARRVVFVSSGGTVYGPPVQDPIPETHPTEPSCSYGVTRLMTEKYLQVYKSIKGLDYTILRVSNPYGPFQRLDGIQGAVGVFLGRVLRGEPIEIWGDGTVVRDFPYVGDVAEALAKAVDHPEPGLLLNIGRGRGTTLNELVAALARVTGRVPEVRYLPGRAFDVPRNVLDVSRAADALGWYPATDLEDGLRLTLEWWSAVGRRDG